MVGSSDRRICRELSRIGTRRARFLLMTLSVHHDRGEGRGAMSHALMGYEVWLEETKNSNYRDNFTAVSHFLASCSIASRSICLQYSALLPQFIPLGESRSRVVLDGGSQSSYHETAPARLSPRRISPRNARIQNDSKEASSSGLEVIVYQKSCH